MLCWGGSFLQGTELVFTRQFLILLPRKVGQSFAAVFAAVSSLMSARIIR